VVGILTAASAVVQFLFGTLPGLFGASGEAETGPQAAAGNDTAGNATPEASTPTPQETSTETDGFSIMESTETPTPAEEPTAVEMTREGTEAVRTAASGGGLDLEPGVAFFLGGVFVVAVLAVTWYYTQ